MANLLQTRSDDDAGGRGNATRADVEYACGMPARARKPASTAPTPEEEAAAYARGLAHRKRIVPAGTDPLPPGVTHVIDARKAVAKRVKRKRFS